MATAPVRSPYFVASRILLGIAVLLFAVGFCMAAGFLFDKKTAEDVLAVDSLGLAFTALSFLVP